MVHVTLLSDAYDTMRIMKMTRMMRFEYEEGYLYSRPNNGLRRVYIRCAKTI